MTIGFTIVGGRVECLRQGADTRAADSHTGERASRPPMARRTWRRLHVGRADALKRRDNHSLAESVIPEPELALDTYLAAGMDRNRAAVVNVSR